MVCRISLILVLSSSLETNFTGISAKRMVYCRVSKNVSLNLTSQSGAQWSFSENFGKSCTYMVWQKKCLHKSINSFERSCRFRNSPNCSEVKVLMFYRLNGGHLGLVWGWDMNSWVWHSTNYSGAKIMKLCSLNDAFINVLKFVLQAYEQCLKIFNSLLGLLEKCTSSNSIDKIFNGTLND